MLQEARGEEKKRLTRLTTLVIEGGVGDEGLHVNVPNTIQQETQVLRGQPVQRGCRNHVKHAQPQVLKHTNTHRAIQFRLHGLSVSVHFCPVKTVTSQCPMHQS